MMCFSEIEAATALQSRTQYLNSGVNGSEQDIDLFRRQRVSRFLVDHLLRVGYFETAQKLAEYTGVEGYVNAEVFQVVRAFFKSKIFQLRSS